MFFRLSQRGFSGCGFLSGLPEFLYLCLKFFLCSGEFCRNVFKVGCRIFQRIRFVRERFFLFLKRDAGIQKFSLGFIQLQGATVHIARELGEPGAESFQLCLHFGFFFFRQSFF